MSDETEELSPEVQECVDTFEPLMIRSGRLSATEGIYGKYGMNFMIEVSGTIRSLEYTGEGTPAPYSEWGELVNDYLRDIHETVADVELPDDWDEGLHEMWCNLCQESPAIFQALAHLGYQRARRIAHEEHLASKAA